MLFKIRVVLIFFSMLTLTSCFSNKLAVIKKGEKYGCINKKGILKIDTVWDYILLDKRGKPNLVELDGLYGYIDRKGNILIEPQFNDADFFNEGLALVANSQDKYGFINKKGNVTIDFRFDENAWGEFSNGFADVVINYRSGYIDKKGEVRIPLIYEICYPFRSKIAVVMDSTTNLKLIDKSGNLIEYNDRNIGRNKIYPPRNSYPGSIESIKGRGRVNSKGDTIVPPIYKVTVNLSDKMYNVQDKSDLWGAYNRKGELTAPIMFETLSIFNEGFASFKRNNKWGFLNKKGEIVIEPKFDYASPFYAGLAYVEQNSKAGFINRKGKIVIPLIYESSRNSFE